MELAQKESSFEEASGVLKCCTDCKTTKTPLWRVGPAGPKSLCNACGIKYRKKRVMMGLKKATAEKKDRFHGITSTPNSTSATPSTTDNGVRNQNGLKNSLKMELMALGKEVVLLQRKQRRWGRRRREMGEVEQAALLLMALSGGSVFA